MAATTTLALHVLVWAYVTDALPGVLDCVPGGQPAPVPAACRLSTTSGVVGWTLTALATLVLLATALFALQPLWRVWRSGLVPLADLPAPELRRDLAHLTDAVGVRARPRFLVDPVARSAGGAVFGRDGRPLIRLDAGLLTLRTSDPTAFRAVVLHELAHVRNRDVTATFLTVAIWRAYLLVTVVPSLATAVLFVSHPSEQGQLLLAATLPLPLVLLARNAVLRGREHHADVTATRLLGTPAAYLTALRPPRPDYRRLRRLALPFRTHPSLSARAGVLRVPALLRRPRFTEYLVAGAALQVGIHYVSWNLFFGFRSDPVTVVSLLWGAAVAGCLGGAVRAARLFRAEGGSGRGVLLRPCAGLTAGIGLGQWVVVGTPAWPGPGPLVVLVLLCGALVLLGSWAGHCWTLAEAVRPGLRRVAARCAVGGTVFLLAVSPLSLAAFLSAWQTLWSEEATFLTALLRTAGGGPTAVDEVLVTGVWLPLVQATDTLQQVGVPVAPALLWTVPLLIAPLRSDRRLLWAGLLATTIWCGFALLVRAKLRETVPEAVRDADAIRMVLSGWELSGVLAAQFAVGLFVAARWGTPLTRSLVAGAVPSVGCGALLWSFFVVDACVPWLSAAKTVCPASVDLDYGATLLTTVMIGNALATSLGHLAGAALSHPRPGSPLRAWRPPTGERRVTGRPGPGADTAPYGQRIAVRVVAAGVILLLVMPRGAPPAETEAAGRQPTPAAAGRQGHRRRLPSGRAAKQPRMTAHPNESDKAVTG